MCVCKYVYAYIYIHVYIQIYIYREREREKGRMYMRERERDRQYDRERKNIQDEIIDARKHLPHQQKINEKREDREGRIGEHRTIERERQMQQRDVCTSTSQLPGEREKERGMQTMIG